MGFGNLLCISHSDVARDEAGTEIRLFEGMEALAFEADEEDGTPCYLVATGRVVKSPESLVHGGSRRCLTRGDSSSPWPDRCRHLFSRLGCRARRDMDRTSTGPSRTAFRAGMFCDDATWARARGWTLWKALILLAWGNGPASPVSDAKRVLLDVTSE